MPCQYFHFSKPIKSEIL